MTLQGATPYHNLILTGHMGVSRSVVGRIIARRLGVLFVDLDTEIQAREKMPADEIRQLYGEARLHAIEGELCRELGLRRGAVLSISGPTLLDTDNRDRLMNSGPVLVLACALNEILRRLYASQGARFHDPKVRSAALNQIRREWQIRQVPDLPTLDTTRLSVEEVAEQAITFWWEKEIVVS
jgi:shikimate kinase